MKYPTDTQLLWNCLFIFLIVIICSTGKRKERPITIYILINAAIHFITCAYFFFAKYSFPYTIAQYSNLYMKQQIGIWLSFIVIAGVSIGIMGSRAIITKILTFFGIMLYSFVFGIVRYILFLFVLEQYSVLYMAMMFFTFGPLFDFVYLVGIYMININRLVKKYEGKNKGDWKWS